MRGLSRFPSVFPLLKGVAVLGGAGLLLWFVLGMNQGVVLSNNIKSVFWPWAPTYPDRLPTYPVLSDPVWQFVPWLEFARKELWAGRLPLWNPHQDGGVPLLGNMVSALGSPLTWPALLVGISPGWNLSLLLRVLLALGAAYAWLRDLGRSKLAACLGAGGFALSGSFIHWLEHPHTIAAAPIPLLLLFAGRLARGTSRRDLVGLALATYLVFAGGHPETLFMAALLTAAAVLFQVSKPAHLLPPLAGALLGTGLALPLLLPFLEYFRLSEVRWGVSRTPFTLPPGDLLLFFDPRLPHRSITEAAAYVSVALLLMVPFGLAQMRYDRGVLFWTLAAACLLAVVYDSPLSRFFALKTPIYWTRALLLLPLALGYLASAGLDAFRARVVAAGHGIRATAMAILLVSVAFAELMIAALGVHSIAPVAGLSASSPLVTKLQADNGTFRILGLHFFLAANSATDHLLDDVRGYDALAPRDWRRRRAEIGRFFNAHHQTDVIEPWGLAFGGRALDLWNVKYLLLPPVFGFGAEALNEKRGLDLEEIYAGSDGRILRNRRVLPRARLDGPGTVRILERLPTKWRIEVNAAAAGSLIVANPAFPGWIARVDGRKAPLENSLGDPIRIPIAAGRHQVDLLYRPLSFWLGLGLAMLCALTLLLLLRKKPGGRIRFRRRDRGNSPGRTA